MVGEVCQGFNRYFNCFKVTDECQAKKNITNAVGENSSVNCDSIRWKCLKTARTEFINQPIFYDVKHFLQKMVIEKKHWDTILPGTVDPNFTGIFFLNIKFLLDSQGSHPLPLPIFFESILCFFSVQCATRWVVKCIK